jgi:hypothetical protein
VIWIRIRAAARRAAPHRNTSWVCVRPHWPSLFLATLQPHPQHPSIALHVRVLTATHRSTCVRASPSSHPLTDDCKRDGRSLKQQRLLVSWPAAVALCGVGRRHLLCVVSCRSLPTTGRHHSQSLQMTGKNEPSDRRVAATQQCTHTHTVFVGSQWPTHCHTRQRHSVEVGALTVTTVGTSQERIQTDPALFPRQWLFWF